MHIDQRPEARGRGGGIKRKIKEKKKEKNPFLFSSVKKASLAAC